MTGPRTEQERELMQPRNEGERQRDALHLTRQEEYDERMMEALLERAKRGEETSPIYSVIALADKEREEQGVDADDDEEMAGILLQAAARIWRALEEEERQQYFEDGVIEVFETARDAGIVG